MAFNQLVFPFVFLPISFILFLAVPRKIKKPVLLILSLLFITWGNPLDLPIILLSVVFNYFSCLEISALLTKNRNDKARAVLISSVAADIMMLAFFKYFNFISQNIAGIFGISPLKNPMTVPVGISFFTFSVLSALFDVYRKKVNSPGNILDFALYVTFFPKLSSGPIIQFKEMSLQLSDMRISRGNTEAGMRMFVVGLAKKVLLANTLNIAFSAISGMEAHSLSPLTAWIGALSYTFMLYFDFSGYSDMAVGLGRVFGFKLPVNFRYPYRSDSVSDFWRRWHASLGAWFRDYVYIPCGGSRQGNAKTIRNLMIVWLLTGIWHGANWTFVLWGVYHGILIIIEKFVLKDILKKIPVIIRRIVTFFLVLIGWVFFFSPDISTAFAYLGSMFRFSAPADSEALYYLASSWLLIIIAAFGSLPAARNTAILIQKNRKRLFYLIQIIAFSIMLVLSIAGMVSDTYTSFLYSQF